MHLGSIVSSVSHSSYIVQVTDYLASQSAPTSQDYGLGTFVSATVSNTVCVGIVIDSRLSNPAFNRVGPRLSAEPDPVFTPDLISETATLLSIFLLGQFSPDRNSGIHWLPKMVVPVNTSVYKMEPEAILRFHINPNTQGLLIGYYSQLLEQAGPYADAVCTFVLQQLKELKISDEALIALRTLEKTAAWHRTVRAFK